MPGVYVCVCVCVCVCETQTLKNPNILKKKNLHKNPKLTLKLCFVVVLVRKKGKIINKQVDI